MADRTIDTYISLHGEQEWRRSIDACKAALAEYKSEINLLNAQYKGAESSLDALMRKEKAQQGVVDTLNKSQELWAKRVADVKLALEEQQKTTQTLQDKLVSLGQVMAWLAEAEDAIKNGTSQNGLTLKDLLPVLNQYKQETTECEDALNASVEAEKNHSIQLDKANTEYNKLTKQLILADGELQNMQKTIEVLNDPMRSVQLEIEDISDELKILTQLVHDKVLKAVKAVYDTLVDCAKASIEFEAALTMVQKTTNMSDAELEDFGKRITDLSLRIPITTKELTKIAEAAGQLGIATEDIEDFTEVMAMMGVATNFTAEEAATSLAQLASVTGMTSDQYSRLGSSIVAVGNNFATTEKNVTMLMQRFAGVASNVGIAEQDMVGLATAVSSLGIAADAGGTALQTLINKMDTAVSTGNNLQKWADLMGISQEKLIDMWKTDATGALQLLIKSLGEADSSMVGNLRDLGISEQRLTRVITLLAGAEENTELLTRALDTSREAWDANNALQEEAGKQFETTESKILMFHNSVDALKTAVGNELLPVIGLAADRGADAVNVLTEFVNENPQVVTAISALTAAAAAFATVVTLNLPAAVTAIETLKKVVMSTAVLNGFTALVAIVAGLGTAAIMAASKIETLVEQSKDLSKQAKETREAIEDNLALIEDENEAMMSQVNVISTLLAKEEMSASEKEILARLVGELNQSIPELNVALNEEGDALVDTSTGADMTAEAFKAMAEQMAQQAIVEEQLEGLKDLYVERATLSQELTNRQNELAEAEEHLAELRATDVAQADAYEATYNDIAASVRILEESLNGVNGQIEDYESKIGSAAEQTATGAIPEMDNLIARLQAQRELFNDAKKAAEENVKSLVKGFDYVAEASTMEYTTIMRNLDSQLSFYTHYADNLQNLNNRNIDGLQEMLQQMQDEGSLTADMVATLADRSDEGLQEIVDKWGAVRDAQDLTSNNMADLLTQSSNKIASYQRQLDDLAGYYNVYIDTYYRTYGTPPAHAQGLEYVPYDDYAALLHEGEMVLTKAEARAYRQEHTHGQSITNNNNRNYGGVTLNVYAGANQDIDSLADEIMYRIDDATKRKEAVWA